MQPSTKQSVLIPQVIKYDRQNCSLNGLFGYDPVENQYKVLCFVKGPCFWEYSCQVFTLGSPNNQPWRIIKSQDNEFPTYHNIDGRTTSTSVCINGIIYYLEKIFESVIGRFDDRFERFDHIQIPINQSLMTKKWLVNYQGKLGLVCCKIIKDSSEMWILEDIEKQEWSKIELFMPPLLSKTLKSINRIAGVMRNGEIVIIPKRFGLAETFHTYFYDMKEHKIRMVELESTSMKTIYQTGVCIISEPNHMENTMDLFTSQFKKKLATRLPFSKKQMLVIAFFCAALVWLATTFRSGLMCLLDSLH